MEQDISGRIRPAERRRSPLAAIIGGGVIAFLAGGALVWTLAARDRLPAVPGFGGEPAVQSAPANRVPLAAPAATTSTAVEAHQAAQQAAQVAQVQGGVDQRVAALEQRLTRLDLQAQAASGNASRAEGLLIAFAARRALERGAPLGYLEDQLQLRFADAKPNAVQAVLAAARDPVTLDQLVARLGELAPALTRRPGARGALSWLSGEFSRMFVVRRANSPSPAAPNRIERARLFLETGRPELAAAEVSRLPNASGAQDWIADAQRYAAAQRALDLLEMTAIEAPRDLRDGAGRPVLQPSPLG